MQINVLHALTANEVIQPLRAFRARSKYIRAMLLIIIQILLSIFPSSALWNVSSSQFDGFGHANNLGDLLTQLVTLQHQRRPMRCICLLTEFGFSAAASSTKLNRETPILREEINLQHQSLRNSSAFEALATAKAQGCPMIVIIFRNGRKLAQLLRAADRFRLVRPQVFLVIPFEPRLFLPRMHSFWRRFLNVIFVRDISISTSRPRRENLSAKNGCFELSTVPFPAPVDPDHPETWLPLKIAIWCDGRFFNRSRALFADKSKNMKGEILRTSFFQHPPAVLEHGSGQEKSQLIYTSRKKFSGVEIKILNLASQIIHFTPLLKEVSGNMTAGVVKALSLGFADVALGSLAYTPYFQRKADLSDPYATYCYTFLTPEVIGDLSWLTLLLPFDQFLWISSAAALLVSWISMNLIARFQVDYSCDLGSLLPSALSTLSMQLMVPLPRMPNGWPLRLLFLSFWLHSLLLSVTYRASFASQLAKPPPRIAIDTLDKLVRADHLRLLTYEFFAKEMFNSTPDDSSKIVGERLEEVQNFTVSEIIREIKAGKVAFFGNEHLLNHIKATAEATSTGGFSVHLNEECVVSLPVSLGLAPNSGLTPQFNKVVKRAVENGLVTKWLQETHKSRRARRVADEKQQQAVIELPKMISIFALLGGGYFLSSTILLGEILCDFYFQRRRVKRK